MYTNSSRPEKTKKKTHRQEKKQGPQVAPIQSTKSTIEDGPWIIKTKDQSQRFYKKIDLILCFILCLLYILFKTLSFECNSGKFAMFWTH